MRIIGGKLRGKVITPPAGYRARPTTDFAKEGLFNTIGSEYEFEDLAVLDLFGGTGSISFEFASRGAAKVHCVEMAPANAAFIRSQAAKFSLDNIVTVVRHNVFDFLEICRIRFDIIFADPPYALEELPTLPDRILSRNLLYDQGLLIVEHPEACDFSSHPNFIREKHYGNVHFSFFSPAK
ncbi:MAG: RsmD family RNA methyltransferase [Bacteroidales bacterium]|nr:RsmD family RNA methyltransferase [Bacteroidales bacterium]